jgi:hypothetical protein
MRRFFRDNGLSLAMFGCFTVFAVGQSIVGLHQYNDDRRQHGRESVRYVDYVHSGDFVEALFENWESEFLQMAAFVWLSAVLVQRGAAESKDPDGDDEHDEDPSRARKAESPWPVRHGGVALMLYSRSLSLALTGLFLVAFMMHAIGGRAHYNENALNHGQPTVTLIDYLGTSVFWFESLQNWQSEFLSVGVLIVFSIFLRQKGSPESKPVHAAHSQTGT